MTNDAEIYKEMIKLKERGVASALAILIEGTGSSPQKAGAKMLVRPDGSILGTVGGGQLEAEVTKTALEVMTSKSPKTMNVELTDGQGYLCGGKVLVYVEPVLPKPRLLVFGAGHVGRALCTVAKFAGFAVIVADDRPEFANTENLPDADKILVNDFADVFSHGLIDSNTYVVIATRGHRHDFQVLKKALTTEACYIGLVGSRDIERRSQ